jgi:hypothetical protein
MTLLSALALPVPRALQGALPGGAPDTAAAQPAPGAKLKDSDFPTDAKHRRRDERARKDKKADPGKPDLPPYPEEDPGPLEAMVEEAIGDPNKRLQALAKLKVPRFSQEYEDDDKSPLLTFLKDLKSGTEKAREYVEYIQQMAERAEKYRDITGMRQIAAASGKLKKITGHLGAGLGKFGNMLEKAEQAVRWVDALDRFADASAGMDPRNRASVEAWVGSMKRLWDATAPFAEWAHGKLVVAAFAGSASAATAATIMSVVGAQAYIALRTLDAGVKNVNAYLQRYEDIMREIDEQSGVAQRPQLPPPPPFPGEWTSRGEQHAAALQLETNALRNKVAAAKNALAKRRAAAEQAAAEHFDTTLLPRLYIAARPKIVADLLGAMRKAGGKTIVITDLKADARPSESRWWDCLLSDDSDPGRMDPQAGVWLHKPKGKVNLEEALFEMGNFSAVRPPYPRYQALIEPARSKHVRAAGDEASKPPKA